MKTLIEKKDIINSLDERNLTIAVFTKKENEIVVVYDQGKLFVRINGSERIPVRASLLSKTIYTTDETSAAKIGEFFNMSKVGGFNVSRQVAELADSLVDCYYYRFASATGTIIEG